MNNWKKTFAIIWTGQLFSTLSSSVAGYAVVFWLSLKTESAEVLAYAMIATLLPQIVLGLFTGVFVDRWNRKQVMIAADTFIALITGMLCLMFYFDMVAIWQIYILLALRSVGSAFHVPAMQASIPLLAPESQLMRVAGVNQMIQAISNIAGPALAALLISLLEMTYVLMFDILGAVIACVSLLFVTIPNPERKTEERHVFREMKEGLKAIFGQRGLGWLLTFDIIVLFFIIPVSALFPLMTIKYFLGEAFHMSVVEIAWGVGTLLGGVIIGTSAMNRFDKIILIIITNSIIGLTFLFSGVLPQSGLMWFAIFTGIGGLAGSIWNSSFVVILQTKIDNSVLGRAFSTYDSLILLPSIPGLLATGYIADVIGLSDAFVIAGGAICLCSILLLLIPSVRELGKSTKGVGSKDIF
ncbi:MFS transporter [Dysgonomonas sp. 25]|uniref:MFS transporter n=1 Tax=Dysgonomonas sp. 25 TaxID=2302933 RepID=UPI0013D6739F|nr:MFS transporter [Dysgonomonas sp. 25]NDV69142.1 MFS transporter [Dysgonomonas sp. 25]